MPRIVILTGSFSQHGEPVQGLVRCTPERLWVIDQNIPWAALAPETTLDLTGSFAVQLTATNTDQISWYYQVQTPAGIFRVQLPWREQMYHLEEFVHVNRPDPGPAH